MRNAFNGSQRLSFFSYCDIKCAFYILQKKTNQIQPKENPTFKPYCVGAQCPVHDTTENISANTFFFSFIFR